MFRLEPRPRRLTNEAPPLPLFTAEPIEGTRPGMSRSSASAVFTCFRSISSDDVTVTGDERSRFGFLMSEPVTTIVSASAASVAAVDCANAVDPRASQW